MLLMNDLLLSLIDLCGEEYIDAVIRAQTFLDGCTEQKLRGYAEEKVSFYPDHMQERADELLPHIGNQVIDPLSVKNHGTSSAAFQTATDIGMSPLAGFSFLRIGENGRLYLSSKSEHYHASLGHAFPGFKLLENAKKLGIPQMTHNNSRGYITRLLERELVRIANGIDEKDTAGLDKVIHTEKEHVLNRVINLQTGSLVAEGALKLLLARFYAMEEGKDAPKYAGKVPVFLVTADNKGGPAANYHGTTVFAQMLRGLWKDMALNCSRNELFNVRPVRINDIDDFQEAVAEYNVGRYRIAGYCHELILMNYGVIKMDPEYIRSAYSICRQNDIPTFNDEIQSAIWYPGLFLYHQYGIEPDIVTIGKGFPGGQYPAARILVSSGLDTLGQFASLVTNGQEEISALSYLITMRFALANAGFIQETGDYYGAGLTKLVKKYPAVLASAEGQGHLSSLFFHTVDSTINFTRQLNEKCIDISAHTYKADCPPSALTKLPIVSSFKMIDYLLDAMDQVLSRL
jgi:acetylornithine/succinyldiaminopimelate/putrescine aminotransferase